MTELHDLATVGVSIVVVFVPMVSQHLKEPVVSLLETIDVTSWRGVVLGHPAKIPSVLQQPCICIKYRFCFESIGGKNTVPGEGTG
jgi:hypothetical protein